MKEIWKSLVYNDIVEGYQLSTLGRIRVNNSEPYYAPYHSMNGYDFSLFILKPTETVDLSIPKQRFYPIDDLLAMTFIQPSEEFIGKRVRVGHIDGDKRNNRIDNLVWEEDIEEWVKINNLDPRINSRYMISNLGNIKNIENNTIMKLDNSQYGYCRISLDHIHLNVHRLVGSGFIQNHLNDQSFVINHINGIRCDNYWKNLEWTNHKQNSEHMVIVGNSQRGETNINCSLNENDALKVIKCLLKHKDDPKNSKIVYMELKDEIPTLTFEIVRHIKNKECWNWLSDKFYNKTEMMSDIRPKLTKDDVIKISESIVKYRDKKNCTGFVYSELKGEIPYLTKGMIGAIKNKEAWSEISDKYFKYSDILRRESKST